MPPPKSESAPPRARLLQFLRAQGRPLEWRELAAEFPGARAQLGARLARMCADGQLLRDRKGRYALPARMDVIAGRVTGHADGYGFFIPDDASGDFFLHHREMRKVLHGDRVLACVKKIDARGRKEGAVVEVLAEDSPREIVGRFHFESGLGFVVPDDPRFARDISIARGARHRARHGDIVAAKITGHPSEHAHAIGEIVEVLGAQLQPGMETKIAIRKHGIPQKWPQDVQAQEKVSARVTASHARRDLRKLHLLTIDGEDARDFDDAVYCEMLPGKTSGWKLVVAIADVSHYVRAGDALDREAARRGNSVYFPQLVVPMLPPHLSDGICSLRPNEDRYCMACEMRIDARGKTTAYQFYAAVMRSHARLTYAQVDSILQGDDGACKTWRREIPHLQNLHALSRALLSARNGRGAIDFEFPEAHIEFDARQKIRSIGKRARTDAHRLIEECMLAANVCAAKFLQKHLGARSMYRNHFGPTAESLTELRRFLAGLGIDAQLGGGEKPRAADYAKLVKACAHHAQTAAAVQTALLRSLSQAVYATEPGGHFALAYSAYAHFTSPIRRYADLIVHRQIRALLAGRDAEIAGLRQTAEHCSFTERRADDATRDVIAWLKAEYMQDKVGEEFDGVISAVLAFGVFVQLEELFVDGLVHVTALGDDYFHYDAARLELAGERGRRRFRIGQKLRVRVARVSLDDAKIDFELCESAIRPRKKHRVKKHGAKKSAAKKRAAKKHAAKKSAAKKPRRKKRGARA